MWCCHVCVLLRGGLLNGKLSRFESNSWQIGDYVRFVKYFYFTSIICFFPQNYDMVVINGVCSYSIFVESRIFVFVKNWIAFRTTRIIFIVICNFDRIWECNLNGNAYWSWCDNNWWKFHIFYGHFPELIW